MRVGTGVAPLQDRLRFLSGRAGENTLQPASSWVSSSVANAQRAHRKDSVKQAAKLPNKVRAGWQAQPTFINSAGGHRPDDVTVIQ
jgi:hypothetical protein